MSSATAAKPLTHIKIQGHRKRKVADALLKLHQAHNPPKTSRTSQKIPIRIVCISDTHNKRPELPPGDILIHAGDLTENGSFEEVQNGLTWLSSQPHRYKIFVAGNHDVLLDDEFLTKYPERRYGQSKTKDDLDWGEVIYLENSLIHLDILRSQSKPDNGEDAIQEQASSRVRSITIFGSPWTPRYGVSAFQYDPNIAEQHWHDTLAALNHVDVVVTHGPPHLHLDRQGIHRAGCPYLAEELHRIRPRLSVFGHIHASYGMDHVRLDHVQRTYEEVMRDWRGWGGIVCMGASVIWEKVRSILYGRGEHMYETIFANAAVVGGRDNELRNEPIVVDLLS